VGFTDYTRHGGLTDTKFFTSSIPCGVK